MNLFETLGNDLKPNKRYLEPMSNDSHKLAVKKHLLLGRSISNLEGFKMWGKLKTNTRIGELKEDGMDIKSKWVKHVDGRNNFKRYYLNKQPNEKLSTSSISCNERS